MTPLSVPDIDPDADNLTAALAYAEAGWYVLPVKRGTKDPGSRVGKRWHTKSSRDPQVITAWFAGCDDDIALHCGRSGAVVFDVDRPDRVPEALFWHLNSALYQSTRPDTPGRGHYVYAMPSDRSIGNPVFDWGEIRGLNGVIIVQPSRHKDGGEYRWQRTGVVPVPPDDLAAMFPDTSPGEDAATDQQVKAFLAEHNQTIDRDLLLGPVHQLEKQIAEGKSRHVSTVTVLVWAMEEAAAGLYPADDAQAAIKEVCINSWARQRTPQDRVLTGAAANSAFHGILAWAVGQANAKTPEQLANRRGRAQRNSKRDTMIDDDDDDDDDDETSRSATILDVSDLEGRFWQRESLNHIYTASLSGMCSPWAVLGMCAAKVLALVPSSVMLPPVIGARGGSLNFFCALAARSGGGKNAAMDVADELIEESVERFNVGSGEGMMEAYRRPTNPNTGEPAGVRESVMFTVDEVGTLDALKNRTGSTLMGMLRSAFTATKLGFATKSSNNFHLDAHTYRLTLVIGVQPALAGAILDDAGAGTPQRFMWFPAKDKRAANVDPPGWPGPLTVPSEMTMTSDEWRKWRYGKKLTIPVEARAAIREARSRDQRDEGDPLDTHKMFVREKFAYALAMLDGRVEMTSDDWELSGIAMAVSDRTREWVIGQRVVADRDEAVAEGRIQGVKHAAADDEKAHQEATWRNRIAKVIVEKLTAAGEDGLTEHELQHKFSHRDRRLVLPVLRVLSDKEQGERVARVDRKTKDRTDRWVIVLDDR